MIWVKSTSKVNIYHSEYDSYDPYQQDDTFLMLKFYLVYNILSWHALECCYEGNTVLIYTITILTIVFISDKIAAHLTTIIIRSAGLLLKVFVTEVYKREDPIDTFTKLLISLKF